jgi:mRNA interferase HigB
VNVVSKHGLQKLTARHPSIEAEAFHWYRIATAATWTCLADVRMHFPSADLIGEVLVFNLRHNRFRLIATVFFPGREIYVKALMTHKEYDRKEWKRWR